MDGMMGVLMGMVRSQPGTAAARALQAQTAAEAAQAAAEEAADTVTSATVAEAEEYLGIEEDDD